MRVLVACEYSGTVRNAFAKRGHYALSCDLLPTDKTGLHYEGDIFDIIDNDWDLMIAHPPCTYLSNSGVCHLVKKDNNGILVMDRVRMLQMQQGANFFKRLLNANIQKICIENPIMHGYAKDIICQQQSQIIQPYMFGHKETKATCLWLKGLSELVATTDLKAETMALPAKQRQRLHYLPPSPDRWKIRSTTYQGIADAMAEQWG